MSHPTLDQIKDLPEYQALLTARGRIGWVLSAAVIIVYFGLILLIAFAPGWLGSSFSGGTTSIGIIIGLLVIFFVFIVTGYYVNLANKKLEPLTQAIHEKAKGLK